LAPPAGYARLRYLKDALAPDTVPTADVINESNSKALSVGTGSDANALPSFMDTFLNVTDEANLVVEHQVGEDVKGLYLQVNENNSAWHINARITIQRI
jgi:ethanolamine utilization protein EutQ (cupin superfamily)